MHGAPPTTTRTSHPCVSQIPTTPPNTLVIPAWVKITQPNQCHRITYPSSVHKVWTWWGYPFDLKAMSSLARELKILVSVVRFRPGPPRILRTPEVAHRISSVGRGLAPFPQGLPTFPLTRHVV